MPEACQGCERQFGKERECFVGPCNFANQGPRDAKGAQEDEFA